MSESRLAAVKRMFAAPRWVWALSIIGTIVVLVFLLAPQVRTTHERYKYAARNAITNRRFDEARTAVSQWLKADPNSPEAYYLLARVELAAGHAQETVNALAKSLDLGYPPEKLAPYRAVIQVKNGQYDEAEPVLRKALADSDEPMPEVAQALANIYLATFRMRDAAKPIARWMRDAPDDPMPYLSQNEIETRSDADHAVIIQNYQEALRRDPKLAKARLGLAERFRLANRLDEAADEFATYIQTKPDDPEGPLGAGRVALAQGKRDDSARHFDRVLELNPREPTALKERGAIELIRGNLEKARGFLERAVKADPFDPDAHFTLSQVLQRMGDPEGAKREVALSLQLRKEHARLADLRSALVRKPKDLALRVEVAQWLLEHGHDEEGLTWTEQILHDVPGHEPTVRMLIDHFTRVKNAGKANYYRLLLRKPEP